MVSGSFHHLVILSSCHANVLNLGGGNSRNIEKDDVRLVLFPQLPKPEGFVLTAGECPAAVGRKGDTEVLPVNLRLSRSDFRLGRLEAGAEFAVVGLSFDETAEVKYGREPVSRLLTLGCLLAAPGGRLLSVQLPAALAQRLQLNLGARRVKKHDQTVAACRGQVASIGAEGHAMNTAGVTLDAAHLHPRRRLPQLHRLVLACRDR